MLGVAVKKSHEEEMKLPPPASTNLREAHPVSVTPSYDCKLADTLAVTS
jgi:hypothetical protein